MRETIKVVLVPVILMLCATFAEAAGTGGLAAPLPSTPTPPVYSRNLQRFSEQTHIDVWRSTCPSGGSIVLARITPLTAGPFVCDVSFNIIQNLTQFRVELTDQSATAGICGTLLVARTFYVAPFQAAYNPEQAFTLVYDGGSVASGGGG